MGTDRSAKLCLQHAAMHSKIACCNYANGSEVVNGRRAYVHATKPGEQKSLSYTVSLAFCWDKVTLKPSKVVKWCHAGMLLLCRHSQSCCASADVVQQEH